MSCHVMSSRIKTTFLSHVFFNLNGYHDTSTSILKAKERCYFTCDVALKSKPVEAGESVIASPSSSRNDKTEISQILIKSLLKNVAE